MDGIIRAPLIVAELMVLGAILAFIESTALRLSLGLLVGILLARAALLNENAELGSEGTNGPDERRHDHLFRHWVNALLKKLREFHTVCQGVANGGVNTAVGQLRIHEIEAEIQSLMTQVTDTAKPGATRKNHISGVPYPRKKKRPDIYGEPATPD